MEGDTIKLGKRRTQVRHMAGLENLQNLELKMDSWAQAKLSRTIHILQNYEPYMKVHIAEQAIRKCEELDLFFAECSHLHQM